MTCPSSGVITLGKIGKEVRATNANNNYDNGPYTSAATSLWKAENGQYGSINQNNSPSNRPNLSKPSTMSEWYSYNHLIGS